MRNMLVSGIDSSVISVWNFSVSSVLQAFSGWVDLLFQIRPHDFDQIVRSVLGRFCVARHVVADVVFHQFAHQAVDRATRGGQALQDFGARLVLIQGAPDSLELPHDLSWCGSADPAFLSINGTFFD